MIFSGRPLQRFAGATSRPNVEEEKEDEEEEEEGEKEELQRALQGALG